MAGPSVIVLPQWQGPVRPLARQLVSGAARLAALARGRGAQVLEPGGFSAGQPQPTAVRSPSYAPWALLASPRRRTGRVSSPGRPVWASRPRLADFSSASP